MLHGVALVSMLLGTRESTVDAFTPATFHLPRLRLTSSAGTTAPTRQRQQLVQPFPPSFPTIKKGRPASDTSLNVLLDVPDYFFATTFVMMGLVLDVSKSFARLRMEERAWEQRLEEARMKQLEDDPTVTELDLRRREAALEWSAYGKPRKEEKELELQLLREEEEKYGSGGRRRGVKTMEQNRNEEENKNRRSQGMSDNDINAFELEYGVEYDPYYDDPYSEDDLPDDATFKVDRKYGDRIYSNGEIFYKDKESGLFYRQGAKPRSLSFW